MKTLFDSIGDVVPRSDWTPEAPPCLSNDKEIYLNVEATGLRWWEQDRPLALTVGRPGGWAQYLPFGHRNGGNLDEAIVKEWALRELRGKRITNINTRFDVHMLRVWGVDLEAQDCEVSDVQHYAALLDDHRQRSNLDSLIRDYLHEEPMRRLDESRMAEYHAGEAAPRAMYNVVAVGLLKELMWPELTAQDLQPVRALEDKVIYPVCEMEKNGSPIDLERLELWEKQSKLELEGYLFQLAKELGWQCNPDSPKDMERAFKQLGLTVERTTVRHVDGRVTGGRPSFTDAILKRQVHPTMQLARRATKLASLRSKFIVNTANVMGSDGILRYSLHQLRATKSDYDDAGEAGTVTGRFSSTEIVRGVGCNIQQRMKAARQRLAFGYNEEDASHDDEIYLVRKLHIAGNGLLLSSDMDQAQYRIFASYANNPRIIQAYRENPKIKFHDFMHELIKPYANLSYRQIKDTNFAYLFGAGLAKMALMVGHITASEFDEIKRKKSYDDPKLRSTKEIKAIYKREVPEVDALLAEAAHLAKPACDERCRRGDTLHQRLPHRGFVKTVAGRRGRFPDGDRLHKAFNTVDQGTEADVMKTKLVELHAMRKETGFVLRITNHDEVVGDISDAHHARMVDKILNVQSFSQLRVPLTWSTGVGLNWADCKEQNDAFDGIESTYDKQGVTDHHTPEWHRRPK